MFSKQIQMLGIIQIKNDYKNVPRRIKPGDFLNKTTFISFLLRERRPSRQIFHLPRRP